MASTATTGTSDSSSSGGGSKVGAYIHTQNIALDKSCTHISMYVWAEGWVLNVAIDYGQFQCTGNPRYNDSIFPKDVAIKMNLLLYRILNE